MTTAAATASPWTTTGTGRPATAASLGTTAGDGRYREMRDMVRRSGERRRPYVLDVELTQAFLSGNQWLNASLARGLVPVENEANEIRVTDNRMLPAYVRWMFYLFQEEPVRVVVALPLMQERTPRARRARGIQVCVVEDDQRIVPTQFQRDTLERATGSCPDLTADGGRTREGHHRDARDLAQCLTRFRVTGEHM